MPTATPPVTLTERQDRVLRAVAEGKTYEQIRLELGISLNGVRVHVEALERKLGVRGRRNLPAAARVRGLL